MSERTLKAPEGEAPFALVRLDFCWVDQIASLERNLFGGEAWDAQILRKELSRPDRAYVGAVASVDSVELLGYGGVRFVGDQADVMTVATVPSQRCKGIGAAIVSWLENVAASLGADAIFLEVRSKNAQARRLYQRAGYKELGVIRHYYRLPPDDGIRMGKSLLLSSEKNTP